MAIESKFSPRAQEDLQLVSAALEGDNNAYANLMSRYKDSIYFMVLKMVHNRDDADDLTMEAFGKAFKNLAKYSPEYAFSTWLFKIATNNCIDYIRKKRISTLSIDKSNEQDDGSKIPINISSDGPNPEQSIIKEQRKKVARALVEELNPKYKILIELRYFKESSYEEIGTELNLPLGTVKAQLFRAKELLSNAIKKTKDRI